MLRADRVKSKEIKKRDTDQLPPLLQRIAEMDRSSEDFFFG